MFFAPLNAGEWVVARRWRPDEAGASPEMAAVLTVTGSSLTRFLERRYGMRLKVRLHDQFVDQAAPAEAALLDRDPGAPSLRRQVSLTHRGSVMFDAESVLPLDALPAELMEALQEGRAPLANLLIERGLSLSRSDLGITRLDYMGSGEWRWARRSVLRAPSGMCALVVECFHPEFWVRLDNLARRY